MKVLVVFTWLIFLLSACSEKHEELPPQYGMLCTADSTKFISTMPGGTRLYKGFTGYKAYNNYQAAVDRAWRQYNYKPQAPDTSNWQKCR